ncbi:BLUF domain-containing protein [Lichenibacterium minor]|uniref:BLUF domain-containing protein n=1 Tax=Lichenibacterium minor TaxID=2316528 RepID=UPI001A93076F|nr:BLUF domain-containing protein [Lichenibacterium minor]
MTALYRLVYTSRSLVGGDEAAQERTVARIVDASRRNNARAGVTGALLFSTGSFAQVLEGPRAAVEATFERIQRDPRHRDLSVLQCEFVGERFFSSWSMGFVGRAARGRALWEGLARTTGFDLGRVEGHGFCSALLALVRADEDGASAAPTEPRHPGLDVERLRSALAAERPEFRAAAALDASPAPVPPTVQAPPAPAAGPDVHGPAEAASEVDAGVLRAALDEERDRTTALRGDLDAARIALARAAHEIEAVGRHRDIWADRGSQLRGELRKAREAQRFAESERDALQARLSEVDTLRAHRDIWAERARALAFALCRDPGGERAGPVQADAPRPAAEQDRPPLVRVAS